MSEREELSRIGREWLMARDVIVALLRELRPDMSREHLEHNAAALIARLAGHDPPILLAVHTAEPADGA